MWHSWGTPSCKDTPSCKPFPLHPAIYQSKSDVLKGMRSNLLFKKGELFTNYIVHQYYWQPICTELCVTRAQSEPASRKQVTLSFPGVQAGRESYTKTGGNWRERHGGGAAGQVEGGLIAKSSFSTFYSHSSVQFSRSVVSDSSRPHELQRARPPCPSPTPRVYSNSCPSSRWCHPAISSSVIPFSSCPQSLPAPPYKLTFTVPI